MITYQPGDRVGDYEILGTLGEGGMGKVYKVRNVISDRVEALKVLHPQLGDHPEALARFMREIKLQAGLDHPNIAELRTASSQGEQFLMVMEFVEGQTLSSLLKSRGKPLSPAEAVEYIWQTLDALAYAHSRGIVHRDIKPANIMLTPQGQVKLLDFGVAKLVVDHQLTATGATLGSLYYMSPEQIRGETVDARSDLYSAGITLYELVTGRRPFDADTQFSIMQAHLEQQPHPPMQFDPNLPQALNDIILMALSKDPMARFQKAEAFKAALNALRATPASQIETAPHVNAAAAPAASVNAPVAEPWQQQAKPVQGSGKRLMWILVGSVATIAVLAVAVIQGPKWFGASAQSEISERERNEQKKKQQEQEQREADQRLADQRLADQKLEEQKQADQKQVEPPVTPPSDPSQRAADARPAPPDASERPQRGIGRGATQTARVQTPPQGSMPGMSILQQQQSAATRQAQTPSQPVQSPQMQTPAQPAVNAAAERDRVDGVRSDLAVRANAALKGLESIEREQRASGLSLRQDMVQAKLRVNSLMDQADRRFDAGRFSEAEQSLKDAELAIRRIERFLGQ